VVHSGDLYNQPWEGNPTQPPVVARETVITVLKQFIEKTGIPVLILEGNHGIYRNLEVSFLDSLKMAIPGLDVATQQDLKRAFRDGTPLVCSYEKLNVYCFPFIEYNVLESANAVESFNDWITTHQLPDSDRPSIAVAHGMDIDRSLYTAIFSMGYDYIALGHDHHQHKHAKNAWYAGSPERWRFDEIRHEKGFLVADIELGTAPIVTPHHIDFARPIYTEKIAVEPDDTVESIIQRLESLFDKKKMKVPWDSATAARVRLVFKGGSSRISGFDLSLAMESFRMKVLSQESEYNIVQLVWTIKRREVDHDAAAYPEIESEYLIEDPEEDFKTYLETLSLDEKYDPETLTRIAVRALEITVGRSGEKLTLDTISKEESG
jgi:DNA repair exonuclease SbcCD nuclease subunit